MPIKISDFILQRLREWDVEHVLRGAMRGSLSGTPASMGPGVPYAIGAKFAHPDRPAVALVGDGAMQMNGMAELITAAKYHQDRQDPRLVVAVVNNLDLNQVTWEMRSLSGAPPVPALAVAARRPPRGRRALHRSGRRTRGEPGRGRGHNGEA